MSTAYTESSVKLSDRRHSWQDDQGTYATVDLGTVDITFDSAAEARAVAAACIAAAEAIETLTAREPTP